MDMVARYKASRRLSKAIAVSFKEANELMDKMIKKAKKPLEVV